jgi:predicted negative regulator of RcsB-dependent stress response
LTRHDLKEQLQHDTFRDNVDVAVGYVANHRKQAIRWIVIALVAATLIGVGYGIYRYQVAQREKALQAAMQVVEAPIANEPDPYGPSFTTQSAKDQASLKALSDVASKYNGTEQGDAAQYYLAGLQATTGKYAEAERNFKAVSASGTQLAALAKVGLAQLYLGQGHVGQARPLLEDLVSHPTPLVSKEQATLLLANALRAEDPKRAKQLAQSLITPTQRPAVSAAANQIVQELK